MMIDDDNQTDGANGCLLFVVFANLGRGPLAGLANDVRRVIQVLSFFPFDLLYISTVKHTV